MLGGELAGLASQYNLKERVHNLDVSSLKPLPEKREVGSGVKKPESQSKLGSPNPAEEEGIDDIDFPVRPLPPATYVGPFGRRRPWRLNRDDPK
jgi:hypothetical protein